MFSTNMEEEKMKDVICKSLAEMTKKNTEKILQTAEGRNNIGSSKMYESKQSTMLHLNHLHWKKI